MSSNNIITLKDVLKQREIETIFELNESQKAELQNECNLLDILALKADIKLSPIANNKGISADIHIKSDVVHPCVVTLGPVTQKISEKTLLRFLPEGIEDIDANKHDHLYLNNKADFSDTEELIDEQIDLFSMIREHFVLALDPLPRVANAEFKGYTAGKLTNEEKRIVNRNLERIDSGEAPAQTNNPFAALADLKKEFES